MRRFTVFVFSCSLALRAFAQLDTNLMREIKSWHKGDAPPSRLLKYPDGKIDTIVGCGLRTIGSEVSDYIWEIQDADLLAAVMFDAHAQPESFHAAVSRLITLKGISHVSRLIADKRKAEPGLMARSELAVLSQLLRSQYIAIQVARIAPGDMQQDNAEAALQVMRRDLQSGMLWPDAYRKHSDLHPDMRDRAKDPKSVRTLIGYLYDGAVSPTGFDIVANRIAETLPVTHLRELFQAKRGTHIIKASDGVYLYHIQSFYDDAN